MFPATMSLLTPLCCCCRVAVVVLLSLFFLLPFLLSLSPFGVILATVIAVATVVVVAPDAIAPAAFVAPLAVVATTVFAVVVALVVDCCVPLLPEEDHRLPPPLGKVPSWPSLLCSFTLALSVALVVGVITALTVHVAFVDCCEHFIVYPHPLSPEASTPQASLVVERFVSIPYNFPRR
jgi:hypothetical protein